MLKREKRRGGGRVNVLRRRDILKGNAWNWNGNHETHWLSFQTRVLFVNPLICCLRRYMFGWHHVKKGGMMAPQRGNV